MGRGGGVRRGLSAAHLCVCVSVAAAGVWERPLVPRAAVPPLRRPRPSRVAVEDPTCACVLFFLSSVTKNKYFEGARACGADARAAVVLNHRALTVGPSRPSSVVYFRSSIHAATQ